MGDVTPEGLESVVSYLPSSPRYGFDPINGHCIASCTDRQLSHWKELSRSSGVSLGQCSRDYQIQMAPGQTVELLAGMEPLLRHGLGTMGHAQ